MWLAFAALTLLTLLLLDRDACPPPSNGAIAQYCPDTDTFAINEARLREDLDCRFCYFRKPTTATGEQKQAVFAQHDPQGRLLEEFVRPGTPGDLRRYRTFVEAHERAHQRLHRYRPLRSDVMHPDTLQMELEANEAAYQQLGISLNSIHR